MTVTRGQAGLGIGGHHHPTRGKSDEWLTPRELLWLLGSFDLDPCATEGQARRSEPWPTARRMLCLEDDGLTAEWQGRVWCNPPYGDLLGDWLARMAEHGHGTALIFARTETRAFFEGVWNRASALLFIRGRLTFCQPDGSPAKKGHNSGGPSLLVAYGAEDARRLEELPIPGALVPTWRVA